MAPRGNHGAPDRAFSVWWRRRPTGSSDGPFSGGARSKRFPRQYTNICVCCSVVRTITEAHCYDAFAKRPVEFTPRSSQGARVLSDVRARGSCHARRTLGRSGGGGGCFLPRVLLRYLPAAAGRAAERVSRAHQAQCQSASGQHRYPDRCFTDDGAGGSQIPNLVRPGWRNRPQLWSV